MNSEKFVYEKVSANYQGNFMQGRWLPAIEKYTILVQQKVSWSLLVSWRHCRATDESHSTLNGLYTSCVLMILMILMTRFSQPNVKFEQQQQIDCWALYSLYTFYTMYLE